MIYLSLTFFHISGLKFGIYEDYGNFTCGGYPGVLGHMQTDANTFAGFSLNIKQFAQQLELTLF